MTQNRPIPNEHVARSILLMRGQRVLLDTILAELYGVSTKALNQAVKRNSARFPADFMFRLNSDETETLNRSQFVTGSQRHRDPRFPPYAFTEHGAIMAAAILNSTQAVEVSVYVVRAFVQLREMLASNRELARQFEALEARLTRRIDGQAVIISDILKAIRELMKPQLHKGRPIGFTANLDDAEK
jgi:hypothetical protein